MTGECEGCSAYDSCGEVAGRAFCKACWPGEDIGDRWQAVRAIRLQVAEARRERDEAHECCNDTLRQRDEARVELGAAKDALRYVTSERDEIREALKRCEAERDELEQERDRWRSEAKEANKDADQWSDKCSRADAHAIELRKRVDAWLSEETP